MGGGNKGAFRRPSPLLRALLLVPSSLLMMLAGDVGNKSLLAQMQVVG